jgi:ABC-type phosphate transport system substrate-binding protein
LAPDVHGSDDESGFALCVDPANRMTILGGGSTAVQPFMSVVAKILGAGTTKYQSAYQPSGSRTGVDNRLPVRQACLQQWLL